MLKDDLLKCIKYPIAGTITLIPGKLETIENKKTFRTKLL